MAYYWRFDRKFGRIERANFKFNGGANLMLIRPSIFQSLCPLALALAFVSCKTRSGESELKEAWISLMDSKWKPVEEASDRNEYIRTFSSLPTSGDIKPLPWVDFERPDISPDLNYAVASILFAEPGNVKAGSLVQSAAQIKSNLVKFVEKHSRSDDGVETRSLGGVCRLDSDSYRKSLEPRAASGDGMRQFDENQCFAVNAGAFHLALTNFIALRNLSFILDPEADQEFVYYPVTSFVSEPLGVPVNLEDNETQLQIKNTVKFLLPSGELKSMIYRYTLQIDASGDIIGGEWLGKAQPQLIWMQNRPRFTAEDKALEEAYTLSVSLPVRMAKQDFSSLDLEDPKIPVRESDPLQVNHKYRIELSGDVPRGADGLKTFLRAAFRPLGNVSIYRNTFADEDRVISIEIQLHTPQKLEGLKQAIRDHSNGRSEIERILR